METFQETGKRLSNWGRWGADDERGTLNLVTAGHVASAAAAIQSGNVFELSLPLGSDGPQRPGGMRHNPIHVMCMLPGDLHPPEKLMVADDMIMMPLQCATQWDALSHVGYENLLYNNVPASTVTARYGAARNSIDKVLPGMVGRGVLLDIARHRGVDWIETGDAPIEAGELDQAAASQGVEIKTGDAVLIRTGWRRKAIVDGWSAEWLSSEPGLHTNCADWLHDNEVATVASDNWGVEVQPTPRAGDLFPLHCILIRDLGMMLGEMFDLEALAADCAEDGRWEFFFSAPPLRVTNGVGSVASPIAVK
jgi:kynurenine formamidase